MRDAELCAREYESWCPSLSSVGAPPPPSTAATLLNDFKARLQTAARVSQLEPTPPSISLHTVTSIHPQLVSLSYCMYCIYHCMYFSFSCPPFFSPLHTSSPLLSLDPSLPYIFDLSSSLHPSLHSSLPLSFLPPQPMQSTLRCLQLQQGLVLLWLIQFFPLSMA